MSNVDEGVWLPDGACSVRAGRISHAHTVAGMGCCLWWPLQRERYTMDWVAADGSGGFAIRRARERALPQGLCVERARRDPTFHVSHLSINCSALAVSATSVGCRHTPGSMARQSGVVRRVSLLVAGRRGGPAVLFLFVVSL